MQPSQTAVFPPSKDLKTVIQLFWFPVD